MSGKGGSCIGALAFGDERGDVNLSGAASSLPVVISSATTISLWRALCISCNTIGAARTRLRMENTREI